MKTSENNWKIALMIAVLAGATAVVWSGVLRRIRERGNGGQGTVPGQHGQFPREDPEELLRTGRTGEVLPTEVPGKNGDTANPVVHRVETGSGHVLLFGSLVSLTGDELTVGYGDGQEAVKIASNTAVFEVPQEGVQQQRDRAFLRSLAYPQTGEVSYRADTKEAIAVTILASGKNNQ